MALFGKILVLMLLAPEDVGKHASQIFVLEQNGVFLSFSSFLNSCLALLVLLMYSNPKNIWQDRVAAASPPHHEEERSMQGVLRPSLFIVLCEPPAVAGR